MRIFGNLQLYASEEGNTNQLSKSGSKAKASIVNSKDEHTDKVAMFLHSSDL